jgi:putative peptide zinc metalloprotease protein
MVSGHQVVRLRELSVVDEGDHVIVGDPQAGVFVAVPPVGGAVVRALLAGASLAQATTIAERFAGQPVDVATFIDRLAGLGFVAGQDDDQSRPALTAALQQRRWLAGPAPEHVRWLFGRAAWTVYAGLFVVDLVIMAARPQLLPRPRAAYQLLGAGAGPSLVALFPLATILVAAHECGHWLAARAAGLSARFGIDHRMYFVVFETDLSQLWALPRRRRFGPLLAGLAVDSTVLAVLLGVQLAAGRWWPLPGPAVRLAAALAFTVTAAMTWQCLLFLRTDLYGVLVAATGCHNLWRVKTLSLRSALRILRPAQAAELAAATPRDRAVATWFRWLWLAGYLAASAWFAWFYLPILTRLVTWTGHGLTVSPATTRFWITVGCAAILIWRTGAPLVFILRKAARATSK